MSPIIRLLRAGARTRVLSRASVQKSDNDHQTGPPAGCPNAPIHLLFYSIRRIRIWRGPTASRLLNQRQEVGLPFFRQPLTSRTRPEVLRTETRKLGERGRERRGHRAPRRRDTNPATLRYGRVRAMSVFSASSPFESGSLYLGVRGDHGGLPLPPQFAAQSARAYADIAARRERLFWSVNGLPQSVSATPKPEYSFVATLHHEALTDSPRQTDRARSNRRTAVARTRPTTSSLQSPAVTPQVQIQRYALRTHSPTIGTLLNIMA